MYKEWIKEEAKNEKRAVSVDVGVVCWCYLQMCFYVGAVQFSVLSQHVKNQVMHHFVLHYDTIRYDSSVHKRKPVAKKIQRD